MTRRRWFEFLGVERCKNINPWFRDENGEVRCRKPENHGEWHRGRRRCLWAYSMQVFDHKEPCGITTATENDHLLHAERCSTCVKTGKAEEEAP